jgi:hypothetical protein
MTRQISQQTKHVDIIHSIWLNIHSDVVIPQKRTSPHYNTTHHLYLLSDISHDPSSHYKHPHRNIIAYSGIHMHQTQDMGIHNQYVVHRTHMASTIVGDNNTVHIRRL